MDDMERMLIERACARLVTEYCHFVDHGEAAKIASQFTDDGVWASPQDTRSGRDAIAKSFGKRQDNAARMSRHVCTNLLIDVIDENNATGVVYLTLYRHDGDPARRVSPTDAPDIIGEYRDTFVRTSNGWRFKRREIRVSFSRAAASARA
jgi:ketosteroid isomerase-like protein